MHRVMGTVATRQLRPVGITRTCRKRVIAPWHTRSRRPARQRGVWPGRARLDRIGRDRTGTDPPGPAHRGRTASCTRSSATSSAKRALHQTCARTSGPIEKETVPANSDCDRPIMCACHWRGRASNHGDVSMRNAAKALHTAALLRAASSPNAAAEHVNRRDSNRRARRRGPTRHLFPHSPTINAGNENVERSKTRKHGAHHGIQSNQCGGTARGM